jgi:predicted secreted protein
MSIGSVIALYFIIWWLTLFAVLPFGVRSQQEAGETIAGSDPGAPAMTRLGRIALINSVVSLGVLAFVWVIYIENWFNIGIINDMTRR